MSKKILSEIEERVCAKLGLDPKRFEEVRAARADGASITAKRSPATPTRRMSSVEAGIVKRLGVTPAAYIATKARKAGKSPEDEADVDALKKKATAARRAADEAEEELRRAEVDDADSSEEADDDSYDSMDEDDSPDKIGENDSADSVDEDARQALRTARAQVRGILRGVEQEGFEQGRRIAREALGR